MLGPSRSVLLIDPLQVLLPRSVALGQVGEHGRRCPVRFPKQLLQDRAAPAASRARSETLAELGGAGGPAHAQMLEQLPQSDVETEADVSVSVHGVNLTGCDRGQPQRNPAGVVELVEIQLFAFHVLLALAAT